MPQVKLTVVPKETIYQTLSKWEEIDQYRKKCSESRLNSLARRYPYISATETSPYSFLMNSIVPIEGPLEIIYLDGQSDAGMPHTRGIRGIALPIFQLWDPNIRTLNHEIVHISQKQYRVRWLEWYSRHWNFRTCSDKERLEIPQRWMDRRRINPDRLIDEFVVWKDRYIPMAVFINSITPDLRYCKRGFWDLAISQWTWEPPPGWTELFLEGYNDEHPHEIAAHWLDGSAGKEKQEYFHLHPI